ncbi:MAG: efflux RND transporter periplasmic adaptor subunit [Rickettsiales bacterium]|jgi:membrane fusion protein, multidrug efflux system|nr:efflux RND transporter periplasmic adaptor subunit [Rickettsiales bacterium]
MNRLHVVKFLLSIALILTISCNKKEEQDEASPLIKAVKLLTINSKNDENNYREISGAIAPTDISTLSFRVSGQVTKISVNQGDRVSKGDSLATLKLTEYKTALNSAKASFDSAQANLVKQNKDLERNKKLYSKLLISTSDMESTEQSYSNAVADVKIAQSNLNDAKQGVSDTNLLAPFSGIIAEVHIDPYEEIKTGQIIITLQSSERFEVNILVPETLINTISNKDIVDVYIPSLDAQLSGTISEIGTQAESGNAYPVVISLAENYLDLFSDMTAIVSLAYKSTAEDVYLIPTSAVDYRYYNQAEQKISVYMYLADEANPNQGSLKLQEIEISDIRGNIFEVKSGLKPGDKIVIAGTSYLSDGQNVKPWQPESKNPSE